MRVTTLGLCLMVNMNEKPLNLEKKKSSVLSVFLLIYDKYSVTGCPTKHDDLKVVFDF